MEGRGAASARVMTPVIPGAWGRRAGQSCERAGGRSRYNGLALRPVELRKFHPEEGVLIGEPALRDVSDALLKRWLRCRLCRGPVTAEDDRAVVEGEHVHRRTNPAGIEFEFGCFSAAPGVQVVGEPTFEFSWFAGLAWAYSLCRGCGTHLGWHFEGRGPAFHGLILDRLEADETPEAA
jgi:hypothetical protein